MFGGDSSPIFVWRPSEGRTESKGVKSQLVPEVPQNTPQTPPNAHVCFIWCIYMLCEVVGCLWCASWTVHGPEIPICDPGVESGIHPDQGHLVQKWTPCLIGGSNFTFDTGNEQLSTRRVLSVEHFF